MAGDDDVQKIGVELDKDRRDVADLWNDALKKYKGIVGDVQPKFTNVQQMVQYGTEQMDGFHHFRHDKKKVDKLRSLFATNIDYIQQGAQQVVAAAAPAFPPAAAIGTALTYMLNACKKVSADYDVVTAFFEDMNAFLQRITILESYLPKLLAYQNRLMDVFDAVLQMCGFATKYIELGRFKKWIRTMAFGEDSDLGGARKNMDTTMTRLESATHYFNLRNTEILKEMNVKLQKNQEWQNSMLEKQQEMLEAITEGQDRAHDELVSIRKLLTVFEVRRLEEGTKQHSKTNTQSKPPTSNQVRSFFPDTTDPALEYNDIKDTLVPDTGTWIFEQPKWETWIADSEIACPRILALVGPPGAGKSHLAATAYDHLTARKSSDVCVVQFFFRETTKSLSVFNNAANWMVIQIAEQSAALCEAINAKLAQDDFDIDTNDWTQTWNSLITPMFRGGRKAHLQIVLDGLDELLYGEKEKLTTFLKTLSSTPDLNIDLLCMTRSELEPVLEECGAQIITATKESQLPDLRAVIWHHLNNDDGLRKLSRYIKQRIASRLEEKSECMLYSEQMLRQFNNLRREPLILKVLEYEMPENLDQIYERTLANVESQMPADQQPIMRTLLCWLSFAYRTLTLDECLSLLRTISSDAFDLEEELRGQYLSQIMMIADFRERVQSDSVESSALDLQPRSDSDAAYYDGDIPLKFQDRSLRGYVRGGRPAEVSLRTSAGHAHREIFVLCSRILCGTAGIVHRGLQQYAANEWAIHLSWAWKLQGFEGDHVADLEAVGAVMTNSNNAASTIEQLGTDYDDINRRFQAGQLVRLMSSLASLVEQSADRISSETVAWAKSVSSNSLTAFVPLAGGHIADWMEAKDEESVSRAFKFARSCIRLTNLLDFKGLHSDAVPKISSDSDDGPLYSREEIEGVFHALPDTPKDDNAYWAIATVLEDNEHHKVAQNYAQKALKISSNVVTRFRVLNVLSEIYFSQNKLKVASKSINDCLNNRDVPSKLLRQAFVTRAKVETSLQMFDEAMASYEEARLAGGELPLAGDILQDAFMVCAKHKTDADAVSLLKKWTSLEKLAWMTWGYDDDGEHHAVFQNAAGRAGEQDFMFAVYNEVIDLLDKVSAAAPIRYELAIAQWLVRGDINTAKTLLSDILDMTSTGENFSFTNEHPANVLVRTMGHMADMIYEQYRSTADPALKSQCFEELKALRQRNLVRSLSLAPSEYAHNDVTLARIARKLGSAQEFQEHLNRAFTVCFEALVDTVGWNDWTNQTALVEVVSNLAGLEKEARILLSAQFSELGIAKDDEDDSDATKDVTTNGVIEGDSDESSSQEGNNEDDEDGDDNDDGDDKEDNNAKIIDDTESLPDDEGDLAEIEVYCDGECRQTVGWQSWKGRTMYQCVICYATALCEVCYARRQEYNRGAENKSGSNYCGTNHKYVRAPIEGWEGVKDGVMTIQSEEPVSFKIWLEDLKEKKWPAAWERWWLTEDL